MAQSVDEKVRKPQRRRRRQCCCRCCLEMKKKRRAAAKVEAFSSSSHPHLILIFAIVSVLLYFSPHHKARARQAEAAVRLLLILAMPVLLGLAARYVFLFVAGDLEHGVEEPRQTRRPKKEKTLSTWRLLLFSALFLLLLAYRLQPGLVWALRPLLQSPKVGLLMHSLQNALFLVPLVNLV